MPGQAVSRAAALPTLPVLRRPKKCCGFSCNTPSGDTPLRALRGCNLGAPLRVGHRNRHGGQMAMRRNIGAVGAGSMAIFLVKHLITCDFTLRIMLFERHALAGTGNSSPNGRFWPLLTALRGRRNS